MKIVLCQPQIPQNTGTIVRTCAATGADLILVRPLGFSTKNRHLKRAGLDYWGGVCVEEIDDLAALPSHPAPFFFSSKATKCYAEISFPPDAIVVFGSETEGLPPVCWEMWPDRFLTIPMIPGTRCLNLACSVSLVLYEALRQNHFLFPKNKERITDKTTLAINEVASGR